MKLHFTLPSTETQALGSVGLGIEAVLDCDGETVVDGSTSTPWFYVLARKPSA
jgi:hypothetical protein